jgi:hypothetical protein
VRRQSSQAVSLALAIAVVVALAIFAQTGAGQDTLTRLGVVGPSEHYTALALVQPLRLPGHLPRTPTAVKVPFTITNRQGRPESYRWQIVVKGATTQTLQGGDVRLRVAQQAYIDPRLILTCSSKRLSVDIRLASGEYVDFLAQCVGGSRASLAGDHRGALLEVPPIKIGSSS